MALHVKTSLEGTEDVSAATLLCGGRPGVFLRSEASLLQPRPAAFHVRAWPVCRWIYSWVLMCRCFARGIIKIFLNIKNGLLLVYRNVIDFLH